MSIYPRRLLLGTDKHRMAYELRPGQLLIQFETPNAKSAPEAFRRFGLQPIEYPRLGTASSLAPTMQWVSVPASVEDLPTFARRLVADTSSLARITAAMPVYFADGQGPESAISPVPGKLLVKLRSSEPTEAGRLAKSLKLRYDERVSENLRPFHQFVIPAAENASKKEPAYNLLPGEPSATFELEAKLSQMEAIEVVSLDWLIFFALAAVPNDNHWASQWDMSRISMPAAWDQQTGAAGIVIAITDSGIDLTHPDLTLTPVASHFNAAEAETGPGPYNGGPDPADINGAHGSLVGGLAAATMNNNLGVAGVAGGCRLLPARVFPNPTNSRLAAAINWSASHGARVINMSWGGGPPSPFITAAINNAWASNVVLCAATGNQYGPVESGSIPVIYPATEPNCIAVGASDQNDQRKRQASADGEHWASHWGPEIDVVAPGVRLWSTDIQAAAGWNSNNGGMMNWQGVNYPSCGDASGNYFALMGGTSGATPHVAGLAALLMLKYPSLTNQEVRDIIERTCDKVNPAVYPYANDATHPNGTWHHQVGYGRINAHAALTYADVMISDHSADIGAVPSSSLSSGSWVPEPFWTYQPFVTRASNPLALPADHETALAGQDNYVHALIRNKGPAVATNILVTWHLMDYPGTELLYPADFNAGNLIASANIATLAAGTEVPVEALWPQAKVNLAAGFVHPCMVVAANCFSDVGGQLGGSVYQYNNIAQHNLSIAPAPMFGPRVETFWMPFAVSHPTSRSRRATLVFDMKQLNGARCYLDISPSAEDVYVRRMIESNAKADASHACRDACELGIVSDTRVLLRCPAYKAELLLKAGSALKLPCGCEPGRLSREEIRLFDATWTRLGRREVIRLGGDSPRVEIPLVPGQVVPLAMAITPPIGSAKGDRYLLHVTQVSEGRPTGGVSLRVDVQ